ncbi:K+-transporting ATPase ATPase A chain [Methanolinea mesophila]|uniref:potassium-transporting ATPase subunit KdpA n=1 Tax=Methanolinea mesophila TaxID=547055 RepID=UPI0031595660|nr:K+-transporting ATPase ATPase A chain [Methanolinea mesophila]
MDILGFFIILVVLTAAAYLLGRYLFRVFSGNRTVLSPVFSPVEHWIYRIIGTDPEEESDWKGYAKAVIIFNGIGFLVLFCLLLAQGWLFLNPEGIPGFTPDLAFNAAASFVTNTNWQVYSGEVAASYLTQVAGFAVQNFLSAGTGICIAIAVMRGLTRVKDDRLGNFWVDLTRAVLYVLVPLSLVLAIFLVSQGVIQNFDPYVVTSGTGPGGVQTIAMGPVASQEAIKELGTNGGGFFNANSAHPFENPTPWTNIAEIFALLLLGASLPFTFGRMAGDPRQGLVLYGVMIVIFSGAFLGIYVAESAGNPVLTNLGVFGPPMEGKEVRFGLAPSVLFAVATTATSCGAVNAMMDSLTPLAGLVPLMLILLGEIVFGGAGSGFYTMIAFLLVAVFIAGLMIGRTPEYLGKKVEAREMRYALLAILAPGILVLILSGIALVTPAGLSAISNPGAHGLSEIVYAFASMANNNGSAFAGLNPTGFLYSVGGGVAILIGRFVPAIAMLAIAGSAAGKNTVPPGPGTLPTSSAVFVVWLIGVIVVVGALTFFPLLAAGPIAEYLVMVGGG